MPWQYNPHTGNTTWVDELVPDEKLARPSSPSGAPTTTSQAASAPTPAPTPAPAAQKGDADKIYQQIKSQMQFNPAAAESLKTGAAGDVQGGLGSTDAVVRDMAKRLADAGLSSIEQFGVASVPVYQQHTVIPQVYGDKGTGKWFYQEVIDDYNYTTIWRQVPQSEIERLGLNSPASLANPTNRQVDVQTGTKQAYINKSTGQELAGFRAPESGTWAMNTAGDGQTLYGVKFRQEDGLPIFFNLQKHGKQDYADFIKGAGLMASLFAPQIGAAIAPSAQAATQAAIGAAVAGFVGSGGDIEQGLKVGIASFVGARIGSWAANTTSAPYVGTVVNNMTKAAILGEPMDNALVSSLTQVAPDIVRQYVPEFSSLPRAVQESALLATVDLLATGGDNLEKIAISGVSNAATDYALGQIDGYNDLRAGQKEVIRQQVSQALTGKDIGKAALDAAIGLGNEAVRYTVDTERAQKDGWKSLEEKQEAVRKYGPNITPSTYASKLVSDAATLSDEDVAAITGREETQAPGTEYAQAGGAGATDAGATGGEAPFKESKRAIADYLGSTVGEQNGITRLSDGTYFVDDPENSRSYKFSSDGTYLGSSILITGHSASGENSRTTSPYARDFINAFTNSAYAQSFTGAAEVSGSDTGASTGATTGGTESEAGFWESIGIDPSTLSGGDSGLSNEDIMALVGYGESATPPGTSTGRPLLGDVTGTFGSNDPFTGFTLVSEDNPNANVYESEGFTLVARADGSGILLDKSQENPEPIWVDLPTPPAPVEPPAPAEPPIPAEPSVPAPVEPTAPPAPDYTQQFENIDAKINEAIQAAKDIGLSTEQAIEAALATVAGELGTTKENLLTQLGATEETLRTEFETGLEGVSAEVKDAYDALTAEQKALADALAQQGVDLNTAIETVRAQTQEQIGGLTSDLQAKYDSLTAEQKALADQLRQQGLDTASAIEQARTALSADVQAKYDALTAEQKALAQAISQQGVDLKTAIELAAQQAQQQTLDLGNELNARVDELMQQGVDQYTAAQQAIAEVSQQNQQLQTLVGTQGRAATQQDVDALTEMLSGQRPVDIAYDVTGDRQITQDDIDYLARVVGGTNIDWAPPVGSPWGPTGLYGQIASSEAQRRADLEEQGRQAAIRTMAGQAQTQTQMLMQQMPQMYQAAQTTTTPIYAGEMTPFNLESPLDVGFFSPSPEKQGSQQGQRTTKMATGGYLDDLLDLLR